jgi:hypothetical protein
MTWTDWIPAISTSSLLTVIAVIVGPFYKAKVEKGVQHNFDEKLEELRAKLRSDEEQLKADLRSRDDEIAALRSGALSGMASRQAALDNRRLEAVEKLWSAVIDRWQWKHLARLVGSLNMDYVLKVSGKEDGEGRKLREFAEVIWKTAGLDNLKPLESIDKERPFLPPMTWALFSAYRQVLNLPLAQVMVMRAGASQKILADPKPLLDLVRAALPHYSDYLDQFGTGGLSLLIEDLEEKLLAEIVSSLESTASDDKAVTQAAAILKAVENVRVSTKSEVELPNFPTA